MITRMIANLSLNRIRLRKGERKGEGRDKRRRYIPGYVMIWIENSVYH